MIVPKAAGTQRWDAFAVINDSCGSHAPRGQPWHLRLRGHALRVVVSERGARTTQNLPHERALVLGSSRTRLLEQRPVCTAWVRRTEVGVRKFHQLLDPDAAKVMILTSRASRNMPHHKTGAWTMTNVARRTYAPGLTNRFRRFWMSQ